MKERNLRKQTRATLAAGGRGVERAEHCARHQGGRSRRDSTVGKARALRDPHMAPRSPRQDSGLTTEPGVSTEHCWGSQGHNEPLPARVKQRPTPALAWRLFRGPHWCAKPSPGARKDPGNHGYLASIASGPLWEKPLLHSLQG